MSFAQDCPAQIIHHLAAHCGIEDDCFEAKAEALFKRYSTPKKDLVYLAGRNFNRATEELYACWQASEGASAPAYDPHRTMEESLRQASEWESTHRPASPARTRTVDPFANYDPNRSLEDSVALHDAWEKG